MFNAPMSHERARYLIEALSLAPNATIVDFGCGEGVFLRLLANEVLVSGVGVDTNATQIEAARAHWESDSQRSDLTFVVADAKAYSAEMSPVDAIICIGAEYAFGGYDGLLTTCKPLLNPSGKLLVGTIYWKQPPSSAYLALLDGQNPYFDLQTTVQKAYDAGYLPVDVGRASDDEWDRFESRTARQRYGDTSKRDATWAWQRGYVQWGINTMGFCFLMLEKAATT